MRLASHRVRSWSPTLRPVSQPYYPEQERSFAEDKCFLCGTQLTSDNRSDEHVIPKWVQHEFALWNQNLTLLNQTPIPYRQLTIPCCAPCNNEHLNRIEVAVSTAWREGFDSFASLNRDVLFLWLAKIVYGLLVRELFLPADRRRPDEGSIVEADLLREFRMHHFLMQGARGVVRWSSLPASIVLVRTKVSTDNRLNFDMIDAPWGPVLTMRLGEVGILSILQDWGCFENSRFNAIERVIDHELAPIQFREAAMFTRYMGYLYKLNPGLMISTEDDGTQTVHCVGSLATTPYRPFDIGEFATMLSFALNLNIEDVLIGDDRCVSWLTDGHGKPLDVPFEAQAGAFTGEPPGTIAM